MTNIFDRLTVSPAGEQLLVLAAPRFCRVTSLCMTVRDPEAKGSRNRLEGNRRCRLE
jgi:hypothetical protein